MSARQVKDAERCSRKRKAETVTKKPNTDSEMTLSTKSCVLCNVNSNDLTNHYSNRHACESYVARLAPTSLKSLEVTTKFAQRIEGSNDEYQVECIFCGKLVKEAIINLFNHYSSHTGEFAFKCGKCKLKKPFEADILRHQAKTQCLNVGILTEYRYRDDVEVIYMYCCTLCNFVQLNKANTLKHLRDQHNMNERQGYSTFVRKYVLAAIKVEEDIDDKICVTNESSEDEINEEASYEVKEEVFTDEICSEPEYLQIAAMPEYLMNAYNTIGVNNIQMYRANPGQVEYFGLLKCMAVDCWFSTDNKDEIIEHIKAHLNSECPPQENLQCAYCQFSANECTSFEMLIEHVLSKHKRSRYQCSYCSYRAITAGHVFLHLEKNHQTENDRTIFRCNDSTEEDAICMIPDEQLIIENVKKLPCPYSGCTEKYYSPTQVRRHVRNVHKLDIDMDSLQYSSCIYCTKDFESNDDVKQHLIISHPDEPPYVCNRLSSGKAKDDCVGNLQVYLVELCSNQESLKITDVNTVPNSCQKNELQETQEESRNAARKTAWIVPLNTSWIENFPCFTENRTNKCLEPKCSALSQNVEELEEHLRTTHPTSDLTFTCSKCTFRLYKSSSLEIVNHLKSHVNDLYICCVCSYFHYDRHKVYDHITTMHRYRDVPVVKLIRSREFSQISIGVVFVEQRKTFSTTRQCFLCSETSWSNYALHLKSTHNITLKYHCEVCDHQVKKLREVDQHFSEAHHSEEYKIRGQFETSNKLSVTSINPFSIRIDHDNSSIKPIIKKELDCEQVDDDDVIIAYECETKKPTSIGYLSCVPFERLKSQAPQTTQRTTQLYPALQLASFGTNTPKESNSRVPFERLQSQTTQTTQQATQLYSATPIALYGTSTPIVDESVSRESFEQLQSQTPYTMQQATQLYSAAPIALYGTSTPTTIVDESVSRESFEQLQSQTPYTMQQAPQLLPAAPLYGTNLPSFNMGGIMPVTKGNPSRKNSDVP